MGLVVAITVVAVVTIEVVRMTSHQCRALGACGNCDYRSSNMLLAFGKYFLICFQLYRSIYTKKYE